MRNGIYPENFLHKIVYHKTEDTYYEINHLPKKYTDKSKTHKGEYYTSVTRLTNNEDKTSEKTVLHINPDTLDNIVIKKPSTANIKFNGDYDHDLVDDIALTKDFHEYINDIHYGVPKYTTKFIGGWKKVEKGSK